MQEFTGIYWGIRYTQYDKGRKPLALESRISRHDTEGRPLGKSISQRCYKVLTSQHQNNTTPVRRVRVRVRECAVRTGNHASLDKGNEGSGNEIALYKMSPNFLFPD